MYWFTLGAQVNTLQPGAVCARVMAFHDCSRKMYVIVSFSSLCGASLIAPI
jgi:hypothetical protein